jgi:hypothetical protein
MKRIIFILSVICFLEACQVIELTEISLNKHVLTVEKGHIEILDVLFIPSNATDKFLTWISTNTKIATVEDGVITGVAPGATDIIVESGNCSDRCKVTVVSPTTGIIVDKHDLILNVGESASLSVTLTPEDSTDPVIWNSSDGRIVTVSDGTIRAIAPGTAVITVISGDFIDKCHVTSLSIMKAIDLGLSVKWSSFNLGAYKPEECGDYYAWGETEPYYIKGHSQDSPCNSWRDGITGYDWDSYTWSADYNSLTKYCYSALWGYKGYTDEKTVLDLEDDAANIKLGGKWRLPTAGEWGELISNCTWTYTNNYKESGARGMIVTSKVKGYEGRSIFLPDGGYRDSKSIYHESSGCYWTSSLHMAEPIYALMFSFYYGGTHYLMERKRYYGLLIRPVSD